MIKRQNGKTDSGRNGRDDHAKVDMQYVSHVERMVASALFYKAEGAKCEGSRAVGRGDVRAVFS